jgi:hypothetical protein
VSSQASSARATARWHAISIVGPAGEILAVNRAWRARHGELHAGGPWTEQNWFDMLIGDAATA